MELAIALDLAAICPGLPEKLGLVGIFECSSAQRDLVPGAEVTRLDGQAQAHRPNLKQQTMLGHECVLHIASMAKCAVTLYWMSRSSATLASSRFRRRISASQSSPTDGRENFFFHA